MRHEFFATLEAAKDRLSVLHALDYLGHILPSQGGFELTFWPRLL